MRPLLIGFFFLVGMCQAAKCSQSTHCSQGDVIDIKDGVLEINGWTELRHVSLSADCRNFIFVYVPYKGLFTFRTSRFAEATLAGTKSDEHIEVHAGGLGVTISSDSRRTDYAVPLWVKFDKDFRIDRVDNVVVGTADDIESPYRWTHDNLSR